MLCHLKLEVSYENFLSQVKCGNKKIKTKFLIRKFPVTDEENIKN